MTTKVTITHSTPGYYKNILVTQIDSDGLQRAHTPEVTIKDGESHEFYLYENHHLYLKEVD